MVYNEKALLTKKDPVYTGPLRQFGFAFPRALRYCPGLRPANCSSLGPQKVDVTLGSVQSKVCSTLEPF